MKPLSFDVLASAIAGNGVGLRARIELEPLGGPGDKVFPASFGVEKNAETKYAVEDRRVNGEKVPSVLLNSVAAEANRIEMAILDAFRTGELAVPMVSIDFAAAGLPEYDRLSVFEVSHRIYDAALRDSLLGDVLFRFSTIGRAITEATPKNAAALLYYAPNSLLFGAWDSTGPRGGRGSKFERAMTSEIVGLNAIRGVKVGSRIDVLAIEKGQTLYESLDPEEAWTLDEAKAKRDKGKPVLYSRKGSSGKAGDPSHANHGNILPTIDTQAGGVSIDSAMQIVVLSFGALRKFRFPVDHAGAVISVERRAAAENAGRTLLAALGIAGVVLAYEGDYDLRSRCVLRPTNALSFELLRRGVGDGEQLSIDRAGALALLRKATEAATTAGIGWGSEEISLTPSERLVTLIRTSRELGSESEPSDN
jgi:CRISPR-associated protein Csb1